MSNHSITVHSLIWCLALFLSACVITPPVQEMSNARQTIQAAKDVGAEMHAPEMLALAQRLLDKASKQMENGDYHVARNFALEAKQQALQARQKALLKRKK